MECSHSALIITVVQAVIATNWKKTFSFASVFEDYLKQIFMHKNQTVTFKNLSRKAVAQSYLLMRALNSVYGCFVVF